MKEKKFKWKVSPKAKKILAIILSAVALVGLIFGIIAITKAVKTNKQEKCEHSFDEGKVIIAATCTTNGETEYTCVKCDFEKIEKVAAFGHTEQAVAAVSATCLESGLTDGISCSTCNAVIVEQSVVPALGHNPVVDKAIAATCMGTGLTEGAHCARCEAVLTAQSVTPAKGHTLETILGKSATCTMPGMTDGTKCKMCGVVYAEQEQIVALGHNLVIIEAKAPTCSLIGWKEYVKCERCDYTTYEELPATGHTYENSVCSTCGFTLENHTHAYQYSRVTQEATCSNVGIITYTCECGEETTEEVAMLAHVYNSGAVTSAVTCTENGERTYTCLNCETTKTETILAMGHNMNAGVTTIAATCTTKGVRTYTCLNCDYTATDDIDELGHEMDGGKVTVAATCTTDGETHNTCTRCGYYTTETISATGHKMGASRVTVAATCTTDGERKTSCLNCDYYTTMTISAMGHTYGDEVVTKEATCTEIGTRTKTCVNCGNMQYATIAAFGHDYGNGEVTVLATCTTDGEMVYTCKTCGAVKTSVLLAYGHDFIVTETVEATCGYNGYNLKTCIVCDKPRIETLLATGEHNYVDGSCSICGVTFLNENLRKAVVSSNKMDVSGNRPVVRFDGYIQKDLRTSLVNDSTKELGMLIIKEEDIIAQGGKNIDWLKSNLSVKYGSVSVDSSTLSSSYNTIYTNISIEYEEMNTKFVAVPYIKTTANGNTTYEYADVAGYEDIAVTPTALVNGLMNLAILGSVSLEDAEAENTIKFFYQAVDLYYGLSESENPYYEFGDNVFGLSSTEKQITLSVGESKGIQISCNTELMEGLGINLSNLLVLATDNVDKACFTYNIYSDGELYINAKSAYEGVIYIFVAAYPEYGIKVTIS